MEVKHLLIILFASISLVHLIILFLNNNLLQAITKSILMPALLLMYLFNAEAVYWPIAAALVFGFAGDVFLLDINNLTRFRLGLVSFLLGHLAYIAGFIDFAQPFHINALAVSFVLALVFGIFMYKIVHPNRDMKIPVIVYETVITAMVVIAFQVFLNLGKPAGILIFSGSLCFLLSDSILARFTFVKKPKYGQFFVMFTYIAAQFLIILGFCL